ncbi:hypothetical protein C5167_038159 [Papaver somniferum]|uniref:DM2 domain-containing protein n=1 Tax=Papaver somniferum TaxID=3469 RepID=A0A4Y7ICJ8_PAPSO|nr:hypothetical protein C5167_038159 [Papaver somniferum]
MTLSSLLFLLLLFILYYHGIRLTKHLHEFAATVTPVKTEKKEQKRKQEKTEGSDDSQPKDKRQKLGFHAPLKLSDALVKFLGTGETSLSRAEVIKKMWEYIKLNNLQDPSDKRQIICDDKLKELFNLETFTGFTVAKHLAVHFVKSEQRAIQHWVSKLSSGFPMNLQPKKIGTSMNVSRKWRLIQVCRVLHNIDV